MPRRCKRRSVWQQRPNAPLLFRTAFLRRSDNPVCGLFRSAPLSRPSFLLSLSPPLRPDFLGRSLSDSSLPTVPGLHRNSAGLRNYRIPFGIASTRRDMSQGTIRSPTLKPATATTSPQPGKGQEHENTPQERAAPAGFISAARRSRWDNGPRCRALRNRRQAYGTTGTSGSGQRDGRLSSNWGPGPIRCRFPCGR